MKACLLVSVCLHLGLAKARLVSLRDHQGALKEDVHSFSFFLKNQTALFKNVNENPVKRKST